MNDVSTPTTYGCQKPNPNLWFFKLHGLERGPVTWDVLQDLAVSGDLKPSDLVRRDGEEGWVVARQARAEEPVTRAGRAAAAAADAVVTERLAAALAADATRFLQEPARPHHRPEPDAVCAAETPPSAPSAVGEAVAVAERTVETTRATGHEPAAAAEPLTTVVDDAAPDADAAAIPTTSVAVEHAAATVTVQPLALPAAAVAAAARGPDRHAGTALLALGLALVGIFKLALPLGLLSLYLGGRSAAKLRRRPAAGGALAAAAAAVLVGLVDVGVSLYVIGTRLLEMRSQLAMGE